MRFAQCDSREKSAMLAMVAGMVNKFVEAQPQSYWREAAMLSSVVTDNQYRHLVTSFANTIIRGTTDGTILDPELLTCFAFVLRYAPHTLSAETHMLGAVLKSLQTRLEKAQRQSEPEVQYQVTSIMSIVLDAMVDVKVSGIDRETLHEPLSQQLEGMAKHQNPRLAQAASYAYQALRGVPDNEGPFELFQRQSWNLIQILAKTAGAVSSMDPAKALDATSNAMEFLSLFKTVVNALQDLYESSHDLQQLVRNMAGLSSQKSWYWALRYSNVMISSGAFEMLQAFLQQINYHEQELLWCGVYAQLEQAWDAGDVDQKERIVAFLSSITPEKKAPARVCAWVSLIGGTLGQPSWRDATLQPRHRFRRWKNTSFESGIPFFSIERIRLEDDPSALLDAAWRNCRQAVIFDADSAISEYYARDDRLAIKRISGEHLDTNQCYINLSLVERSQGEDVSTPDQGPSRFTLFKSLQVGRADKAKNVNLTRLFDDRESSDGMTIRPRRILIRGRAGVGKSTLCKKIVYDFLHGQLWEGLFDRILWIPLRMLKDDANVEDLLCQTYLEYAFPIHERRRLTLALCDTVFEGTDQRTLLLLDGLDEISGSQTPRGRQLIEALGSLLNHRNAIVTSRPYATDGTGLARFDLELETIGFRPDQVETYITKTTRSKSTADAIREFIGSHQLVQGLVQIPIQLDALCYTWDGGFTRGGLETMTALYEAMEQKLWTKDILKLGIKDKYGTINEKQAWALRNRSQLERRIGDEMRYLEFLGFTGLYSNTIEFDQDYRDTILQRISSSGMVNDLSFIHKVDDYTLDKLSFLRTSNASNHKTGAYHFIHLTYQEFFAARHFIRHWISGKPLILLDPKSEKRNSTVWLQSEEFLRKEKYNTRYDIFWRFVTGLLWREGDENLSELFEKFGEEPHDLLGPMHLRLSMHCFSEVPPSDIDSHIEQFRAQMKRHCKQWSLFEFKLLHRVDLCREMEFPDDILSEMLQSEPDKLKVAILEGTWNKPQLSPCLLETMVSLMNDATASVEARVHVIHAFGEQSYLPEKILEILMSLVQNTNVSNYFRASAIYALGKRSVLPENALKVIVSQLTDTNVSVRTAAVFALVNHSLIPKSLLEVLESHLETNDHSIKASVISALGTQNPLPDSILKALISQLEDYDPEIKALTFHALKWQSLQPETVQNVLLPYLKDANLAIRSAAMGAIGSQMSIPERAFETLIAALKDADENTKNLVGGAVHRISTRTSLPTKVMHRLVYLSGDADATTRRNVVSILDGQPALPEHAIESLLCRLSDPVSNIREITEDTLSKQPLPGNTWKRLVSHSTGTDVSLRRSAISILGRRMPLTENILEDLVSQLEDTDGSVRQYALSALKIQSPLPDKILNALLHQMVKHAGNPSVRGYIIRVLGAQSALPERALEILASQSLNTNRSTSSDAFSALENQSFLPVKALEIIATYPKCDDTYFESHAGKLLWRHANSSTLPTLKKETLRLIYRMGPEYWTQEPVTYSVQDGNLFVQTSFEREVVPVLERKDEILRAFWDEAVAMGSPITEWYKW